MTILEVLNGRAFPTAHALSIPLFAQIMDTDDDPQKSRAIKVFSYIEFMCSPKKSNPFLGYSPDLRPLKVKKELWGDENYPDTQFMILGILKYMELLENYSPSYPLLEASLESAERLKELLKGFDLNERTASGGLVLKPKDITSALKEIPLVIKALEESRAKVEAELAESSKTRKDRDVGVYER
jgi:hypothetical protein